jgi:hypothetical protein
MDGGVLKLVIAEFSNNFPAYTLTLNETLMRLRMLAKKLTENQQTIGTVYAKVSLGGLAKDNSRLALDFSEQVDVLTGLCWAQITDACSPKTQLDAEQWQTIGTNPPEWLRSIFEGATLMTGLPVEDSMAKIHETQCVLVIRDPALRQGTGLLPTVAALLPKGYSTGDARIWWPWVMGGETPVVLAATENPFVLQEYTLASLQSAGES